MKPSELISYMDRNLQLTPLEGIYPPPYECFICTQQFQSSKQQANSNQRAYTITVTNSKTTDLIVKILYDIQKNFAYLQKSWQIHGKTISARWCKKSCDKREALLLKSGPNGLDIEPKQRKEAEFMSGKGKPGIFMWTCARVEHDAVSQSLSFLYFLLNYESLMIYCKQHFKWGYNEKFVGSGLLKLFIIFKEYSKIL